MYTPGQALHVHIPIYQGTLLIEQSGRVSIVWASVQQFVRGKCCSIAKPKSMYFMDLMWECAHLLADCKACRCCNTRGQRCSSPLPRAACVHFMSDVQTGTKIRVSDRRVAPVREQRTVQPPAFYLEVTGSHAGTRRHIVSAFRSPAASVSTDVHTLHLFLTDHTLSTMRSPLVVCALLISCCFALSSAGGGDGPDPTISIPGVLDLSE